jgi:hypothetical protein
LQEERFSCAGQPAGDEEEGRDAGGGRGGELEVAPGFHGFGVPFCGRKVRTAGGEGADFVAWLWESV